MNNAFVKETERMACQIMFTDGTNKEKNVSDPAESVWVWYHLKGLWKRIHLRYRSDRNREALQGKKWG